MLIDTANRQTTITDQAVTPVSGGGSTITPLATYVYSYDNADRVTSEKDAEGTASFTYDNAHELTAVSGSRTESYSYDLNGNRTGTGYSTTVMNETATSPGTTYTYDNAGNMISAKTGSTITTYTYDYRNRLTEVTTGGSVVATYTYNALDQRIGIKDNSTQTWTVYNGSDADATPYADFNGSGSLTQRYLYGPGVVNGAVVDELLARTSAGGTTAWYLPDKLGSVRDIVSPTGTELDHVVYDSFGNVLTETNATNGDRFKYAGMEFDSAIGQYYDRARFYDAATGRFMGQDPMAFGGGDSNLYRYVTNGPANSTDPTGLDDADTKMSATHAPTRAPATSPPRQTGSVSKNGPATTMGMTAAHNHRDKPVPAPLPTILYCYDGQDPGASASDDFITRATMANGNNFKGPLKWMAHAQGLDIGKFNSAAEMVHAIDIIVTRRGGPFPVMAFADHSDPVNGQQMGKSSMARALMEDPESIAKLGTMAYAFDFMGCESALSPSTMAFAMMTGRPITANLSKSMFLTWGPYFPGVMGRVTMQRAYPFPFLRITVP